MGPETRVYLLMVLALVAGVLLGAALIRNGWMRAYGAVLVGHLLAAAGLFVAARQGAQMQGLGYAVVLGVFVLPASLGIGLGGGFVWWRIRRAQGS